MPTGTGTIHQRLLDAWIGELHVLQNPDFKGEALAMYRELVAETTRRKSVGDEGDFAASLLAMTNEETSKHAERTCELFHEIALLGDHK